MCSPSTSRPCLDGDACYLLDVIHRKLTELLSHEGVDTAILASATVTYDFAVDRPRTYRGAAAYDCVCELVHVDGGRFTARIDEAHHREKPGQAGQR